MFGPDSESSYVGIKAALYNENGKKINLECLMKLPR